MKKPKVIQVEIIKNSVGFDDLYVLTNEGRLFMLVTRAEKPAGSVEMTWVRRWEEIPVPH